MSRSVICREQQFITSLAVCVCFCFQIRLFATFSTFSATFQTSPPDCVLVCFVCEVAYSCTVILVHYILFCCCFPWGFYALKDASGYPPVDTRDDVQRYPLVSPLPQMTFNATCGGGAPVSARSADLIPVFFDSWLPGSNLHSIF